MKNETIYGQIAMILAFAIAIGFVTAYNKPKGVSAGCGAERVDYRLDMKVVENIDEQRERFSSEN